MLRLIKMGNLVWEANFVLISDSFDLLLISQVKGEILHGDLSLELNGASYSLSHGLVTMLHGDLQLAKALFKL